MKKLNLIWMVALCLVLASMPALAAKLSVGKETQGANRVYTVKFAANGSVDDYATGIPTCPVMSIRYFQATAAVVRVYEINPDDRTVADIESGILAAPQFTATTTASVIIEPGAMGLGVVVDTAETTGESRIVIECLSGVVQGPPRSLLFSKNVEATGTNAIPDPGECYAIMDDEVDVDNPATCTTNGHRYYTRDGFIVDQLAGYTGEVTIASNTRGCAACFTIDGGLTCVGGSAGTLKLPRDQAEQLAAGSTDAVGPITIPPGSIWGFQLGSGDASGTENCISPPCLCTGGQVDVMVEALTREIR